MMTAPRRLRQSLSFRLAFFYGILVAITMLVSLSIVYAQTVGVMYQAMARQVASTEQRLLARYADGGLDAVAGDITRALGDGLDTDAEIYLLTDSSGAKLAGNIEPLAEVFESDAQAIQRTVIHSGRPVNAYLVVRMQADGGRLIVGRNMRDLEAIESLVKRASASAVIVALLLLLGGTFLFRLTLENSIGVLRRTAARIVAGNLRERVALSDEDDEFALLNRDINAMLDRIESLMDGVRHVSDTIAHNLRTPLTRIMLRLREADDDAMPARQRKAAIALALKDIEDLTTTFEKLLQITEAEAGTRRRNFTAVALHTIADDVLELYDEEAASRRTQLRREPSDEVMVQGDSDLLASMLANLVDNALKYAGESATVLVGTRHSGGFALLTVRDNGPGVPPAEYSRISERFHRLSGDAPGHGLGLASVAAIVALHGGAMRFADAQPGLLVEVRLPHQDG